MDKGKKYVVYGMRVKCSEGCMENYLSTDTGHGVVYQGQPVMNANDHVMGINLTHFGECGSKIKANVLPTKCTPLTPLPWLFVSEDHMIDGAPALMMESMCPCALGGVISIVPEMEEVAEEEVVEEEKGIWDTLSEAFIAVAKGAKSIGEFFIGMGALYVENQIADIASGIHKFFNPYDEKINFLQAALSFAPESIKERTDWLKNQDIKEIDQTIRAYEDKIYEKYQDKFEEYNVIRNRQDIIKNELKEDRLTTEERLQKEMELNELNEKEIELFQDTSIMDEMISMGNELNSMTAITAHKNDMVNFFNLVYTNNPIDLKSREYVPEGEEGEVAYSIWSRPWANENGGTFSQDYAGNWLFGYVGTEYFATPADGELLKYGAGLAQFISDGEWDKYVESLLAGNYGDNVNENGLSDAQMIQDGVDAYYENKK